MDRGALEGYSPWGPKVRHDWSNLAQHSTDRPNNRVEMTEDTISELYIIDLTWTKKETRLKKNKQSCKDNNSKESDLCVIRVDREGLKEFSKNNGWKLPKFDEEYKFTSAKTWQVYLHGKSQEIYILNKTIINEWVQQGHMIQIKT